MGLKADITNDIREAYANDLADAYVSMSYISANSSYDPTTGNVTDSSTGISFSGVMSPISNAMIDGETIRAGDVKILILVDDISATPSVGSKILCDGIYYDINVVNTDPVKATWTVLARGT